MPEPMITPVRSRSASSSGIQSGVAHRLLRRRHRVEDEGVDLALVLRRHPVVGVERPVRPVAVAAPRRRCRRPDALASKRVILPAPDCPATSRAQVSSTPQASGDTMPSPVMTTRRIGRPLARKSAPFSAKAENPTSVDCSGPAPAAHRPRSTLRPQADVRRIAKPPRTGSRRPRRSVARCSGGAPD